MARGHEISPEGNAHQSELSHNFTHMIATDEDFNPYRLGAEITSGPNTGLQFRAIPAGDAAQVTPDSPIAGTPTYVGLACPTTLGDVVPEGEGIALVERGACPFQEKIDAVDAAGYSAGIVMNSQAAACGGLVNMAAAGDIPFLFVDRPTGLAISGTAYDGDPCATAVDPSGEVGAVSIRAIFDGWGYVRLFRTHIPEEVGVPGSISQIDTYAIPESQDEDFATGFGDLSVHEVAMDPRPGTKLAYLSYYAGGLRVVKYGNQGIQEVGAFIDEGGNNFWGVEVHQHPDGQYYVLASDRDFGLYIFQYGGRIPGGNRGGGR